MEHEHRFRRVVAAWWPGLVLAVASIWVVQPMHDVNWWASHEAIWYPVRVHEYLESWDAGVWYPRWCPNLYGGYGYPFLHYYAPGVYFSSAAVSKLGSTDPISALKIVVTITTMASAVGTYGLIRSETSRTDAALLGSACYVFLPYRCTNLFARGDIAEYSAYCLVPFVVWSYRALARSSGRRTGLIACVAALTHAGVLLTHTLMGMFTTELAGLYVVTLLARKQHRSALLATVALLTAIALAAVYVMPAFFERDLVHLERVTNNQYKPWLNAVTIGMLRQPFYTPGWPFMLGVGVWLLSFAIPKTRQAAIRAAVPWTIAVAMVVLMLPQIVPVWKIVPFGAEVQFPWRLLGFIGLFCALGVAIWWAHVLPNTWYALVLAALLCLPLPALLSVQRRVGPAGDVPLTGELIRAQLSSSTVMDEYLPRRVQFPPPHPRTRHAWSDDPGVVVSSRELDGLHHEIEIETPSTATVTLAVFGFRGWHAKTLEGPTPARLRFVRGDGFMRLFLPEPGRYKVVVFFGQTPFRILATLISLAALLALYPLMNLLARRLT